MSEIGKIDISKLSFPPERHEYETAKFFTKLGYDVIFIRPSSIQSTKTICVYHLRFETIKYG